MKIVLEFDDAVLLRDIAKKIIEHCESCEAAAEAPQTILTPATVPVAAPAPQPAVPVAKPLPTMADTHVYTRDELAIAATTLVDANRLDELTAALHEFGAQYLPDLKEADFGPFAEKLRSLGVAV